MSSAALFGDPGFARRDAGTKLPPATGSSPTNSKQPAARILPGNARPERRSSRPFAAAGGGAAVDPAAAGHGPRISTRIDEQLLACLSHRLAPDLNTDAFFLFVFPPDSAPCRSLRVPAGSQVFYTNWSALTNYRFGLCSSPPYALSVVYSSPADIQPASRPVDISRTCRTPADSNIDGYQFLSVSWPEGVVNASSANNSFCTRSDPANAQCYTEDARVYISFATQWDAKYANGTAVPQAYFNGSEARTLRVNMTEGSVNRPTPTGCVAPGRTSLTTASTATATASTSRPGGAAGLRAGMPGLAAFAGVTAALAWL
ncbi:hypothetical protein DFJ74DRAFT_376557 [Hyaloraphidium curvatum]|nr:hypothetical protein DFJ74DRAFT_376557 [Hyaloraphidium curvatum]